MQIHGRAGRWRLRLRGRRGLMRVKMTRDISAWTMVQQHLEKEMRRVNDEIRNYPAPIPACDAQFNYLLEEREALSSELIRVRELMKEDSDSEDARSVIDAFLSVSTYVGDSVKREIRALIDTDER